MKTDRERIDFLECLNKQSSYTGLVVLRQSTTGRGWRLHETSQDGAVGTVRGAIDLYMDGVTGKWDDPEPDYSAIREAAERVEKAWIPGYYLRCHCEKCMELPNAIRALMEAVRGEQPSEEEEP